MKRKMMFSVIVMVVLLLASCTQTPQSVVEKTNLNKANNKMASDTEITKATIPHLLDNKEEILAKKYQNIELPKKISAQIPEKVGVLHMHTPTKFATKNAEKFFAMFYKKEVYKNIVETIPPEKTGNPDPIIAFNYTGKPPTDFGQMDEVGFSNIARENVVRSVTNRIKVYHVLQGDDLGDVYQLKDGKMSIREAVDKANEWCNTHWKEFEKQITFRVKNAFVCEDNDGKLYIATTIVKCYQGIPFNDIAFAREDTSIYDYVNLMELSFTCKESIPWFYNDFVLQVDSMEEEQKEYIDLAGAVSAVEHIMSAEKKYIISDVMIKYMVEGTERHYKKYEVTEKMPSSQNMQAVAHPVWSFIITHKDCAVNTDEDGKIDGEELQTFINVDMYTGQIHYQDQYGNYV